MRKVKVIGTKIEAGFRYIKTTASLLNTNAKVICGFGFQSNPYNGVSAVTTETESDDVIIGFLQKAFEGLEPGESVMLSMTKEGPKATIINRVSGQIELNGTGDHLVKFKELKSEYDKTKAVVDAILDSLQKVVNEPGEGAPSAFQAAMILAVGINKTGDISGAKAETLETS